MATYTGPCKYGCEVSTNPGTPLKVGAWGLCRKCMRTSYVDPWVPPGSEPAEDNSCGYPVRNQGNETDGSCNARAVIKYSQEEPLCRLHHFMKCCGEAQEKIVELEKDLRSMREESSVSVDETVTKKKS